MFWFNNQSHRWNKFLVEGTFNLPDNFSISFQTPATFIMENIVRLHYDVMFYIAAAFSFVLFVFLELNIYWVDKYKKLDSVQTNFHVKFLKNSLIYLNQIIFLWVYTLAALTFLILHHIKNIQIFTNYRFNDIKFQQEYGVDILTTLEPEKLLWWENIFGNYIFNKQEVLEILFIKKSSLFHVNYNSFLSQFFEYKLTSNLTKFQINFFTNNYKNNNKFLIYYFYELSDLIVKLAGHFSLFLEKNKKYLIGNLAINNQTIRLNSLVWQKKMTYDAISISIAKYLQDQVKKTMFTLEYILETVDQITQFSSKIVIFTVHLCTAGYYYKQREKLNSAIRLLINNFVMNCGLKLFELYIIIKLNPKFIYFRAYVMCLNKWSGTQFERKLRELLNIFFLLEIYIVDNTISLFKSGVFYIFNENYYTVMFKELFYNKSYKQNRWLIMEKRERKFIIETTFRKFSYVDFFGFFDTALWSKYFIMMVLHIFQTRLFFHNFYHFFVSAFQNFENCFIIYLANLLSKITNQCIPAYLVQKEIIIFLYRNFFSMWTIEYMEMLVLLKKWYINYFSKINLNINFKKILIFFFGFLNIEEELKIISKEARRYQNKTVDHFENSIYMTNLSIDYYNLQKDYRAFSIINKFKTVHLVNDYIKMNSKLNKNYFLLEIFWTLVPSFVIILILVPSLNLLYSLEFIEVDPLINLKIVGNQWYWSYEYASNLYNYENMNYNDNLLQHLEFNSFMLDPEIAYTYIAEEQRYVQNIKNLSVDRNVILPKKTHIQLLITSNDVLHSWAVPAFGIKMDACPGRLNQVQLFINREGIYYGQCSELCGINHGFMPIVIDACDMREFFMYVISNFPLFNEALAKVLEITTTEESQYKFNALLNISESIKKEIYLENKKNFWYCK